LGVNPQLLAGIQKKSLDARPSLRWGRLFAGITGGDWTLFYVALYLTRKS